MAATDWTYADDSRSVARRITDGGEEQSALASSLPEGTVIADPPTTQPPIPEAVTAVQGRLALLQNGLYDQVNALLAQQSQEAQIRFNGETRWRRDNELLNAMAVALGLASGQVDDLFRLAATK